jgi:polysaccharide export outer membrane protein
MLRLAQNTSSQVTVFGDVNSSNRLPLTPKGERILDALAMAGGVKENVIRTSVKLSRQGKTATMSLSDIIDDPAQNILLNPGDIVTVLYQPNSFIALGATGKNEEIPFEAKGISLAQALARSGGTLDNRADARAVYVFRFEDSEMTIAPPQVTARRTADDKIPIIYQINLRDPATFFIAQDFPMKNGDLLYVATAPAVEFQKFLNMLLSVTMPTITFSRALE